MFGYKQIFRYIGGGKAAINMLRNMIVKMEPAMVTGFEEKEAEILKKFPDYQTIKYAFVKVRNPHTGEKVLIVILQAVRIRDGKEETSKPIEKYSPEQFLAKIMAPANEITEDMLDEIDEDELQSFTK